MAAGVAIMGMAMAAPVIATTASADPCLPPLVACPSPSPSPSPAPKPSPTPTQRPQPQPNQGPAPAPAKTTSAAKPSGPAAATSNASGAPGTPVVAAQFQNAPFLNDLLAVLDHPVSADTPDLKHFRLDAAAVARAHAEVVAASRAERTSRNVMVLALVLAWALVMAATAGLWRHGRRFPVWARRSALVVLPAMLTLVSSGMHVQAVPRPAAAALAVRIKPAPAPAPLPAPTPAVMTAEAWLELVSVETQLAHDQDAVKRQEDRIRAMAASPDNAPQPYDWADSPNLDRTLRADPEARDARKLSHLLDDYHQEVSQYKDTLRKEYELYRGAAQDPQRKEALVSAASASPKPEVADAVNYNLTIIQAQLDQEAAIKAAEDKLQQIGSLSGEQLAAIQRHQPFIIPVEAPIIQGFGPTDFGLEPSITYNGVFYPHFHTGVDIVGPENAPVHAAADGVVLLATNNNNGYGNYVVIAHPDGFVTLYGHMNSLAVNAGDLVHQGQIIGLEGSTGMSTGPHVHFEIRLNGEWVDPQPYLTGQAST